MRPWHLRRPDLLQAARQDIANFCPTLHLYIEDGVVLVRGTFPVLHGRRALDRYSVLITFPVGYPGGLPRVQEVGGRIPQTPDRHNSGGVCCLFLPEKRAEIFPEGAPFLDFLSGPMHNYFLGQTLVERGEKWPWDEEEHGAPAIWQFYGDLFNTTDQEILDRLILFLATEPLRGHLACPCGSGEITRRCHFGVLLAAQKKVSTNAARRSYLSLHPELVEKFRKAQRG